MAVTRRSSKTTKATNNITSNSSRKAGKQKPGTKQTDEEPDNQPGHRLKHATEADTKKLTSLVFDKALKGDKESVNQYVKLSTKPKPPKSTAKKHRGLTLAQRLALEPPWQEEPDQCLESGHEFTPAENAQE